MAWTPGKNTTSGQSASISIAATNGGRYLLAFGRQERNPLDSSSMSFDGVPGTQIGTAQDSTNCRIIAFWWDDADLPSGAGSYNLTINGSAGSAALSLEWYYNDGDAAQGAPTFSDGGTALASPIQDVFSGLSSGALRVVAAIESSSTSSNSALTDCTLNANEAIVGSLTFFQGSAYSTTTNTVGFTSDDTYEGWISVGVNPASAGPTGDLAATESGDDTLAADGGLANNGIRLTLRDTDTGALFASETGLIVSVRETARGAEIAGTDAGSTDGSGVLELAHASIEVGTDYRVFVEDPGGNVAGYLVQGVDLTA